MVQNKLGGWKIIDKETNVPIYTTDHDGKDVPVVIQDEDIAVKYLELLNK